MSSSSIAIPFLYATFSAASFSSSAEDYNNPQMECLFNIRAYQSADSSSQNFISPYWANFQVRDSKYLTTQNIYKQRRLQMLNNSFEKHKENCPGSAYLYINRISAILSKIPFDGSLVEYNEFDESVEYCLMLPFDICVRVSCFIDDDDVAFTIHRQNKLLVADELSVSVLAEKLNALIRNIPTAQKA